MNFNLKKFTLPSVAVAIGFLIWQPWQYTSSLQESTVIIPAKTGVGTPTKMGSGFAIFYSGDGGWEPLEQQVSNALSEQGIPVLGINTFTYFWREKTADKYAEELDTAITQYRNQWGKQRVWLIGFSFGANVLPSIINKLTPQNRDYITQLVMLEPTKDVFFEIELEKYMKEGWWNLQLQAIRHWLFPVKHYDALPALNTLQGHPPTICYYGTQSVYAGICSSHSLPTQIITVTNNGGHYFHQDFQGLARQMIENLPKSEQ